MIHFFCALRCEASTLIEHYKLFYLRGSQFFGIYVNKDNTISLTVTGIGKLSAAAAVMYNYTILESKPADVWLNVGIAGHADHSIGDIYVSNKIEDSASGKTWFPQLVTDTDIPSENLLTLDRPSTNYVEVMFDMEASGFFSTVTRFATSELTHSIKIISDNREKPAGKMSEDGIRKLVESNITRIVNFAKDLEILSSIIVKEKILPDDLNLILEQWHFSQYQRNQLEQLLHRWHLLLPDLSPIASISPSCKNAKTVLKSLLHTMDESVFSLDR